MRNPGVALIESIKFLLNEVVMYDSNPTTVARAKAFSEEIDELVAYEPAPQQWQEPKASDFIEAALQSLVPDAPRSPLATNDPQAGVTDEQRKSDPFGLVFPPTPTSNHDDNLAKAEAELEAKPE